MALDVPVGEFINLSRLEKVIFGPGDIASSRPGIRFTVP
jgi:hypothetical protein